MKRIFTNPKSTFTLGFLAGLGAGIVASIVMLVLNVTVGGVSLPEEFGSELTALMPPPMFEYLHQLIGADAKHMLFYIVLVGQCLVFALSGGFFLKRLKDMGSSLRWYHGLLLALLLWLFAGLILLPFTEAGIFGANLTSGLVTGMLSLAVVGLVFGLLFTLLASLLEAAQPAPAISAMTATASPRSRDALLDETDGRTVRRRAFLRDGLIVAGLAVVGVGIWEFISSGVSASKVPVSQLLQTYKKKIVPPPTPNYGVIQAAPNLSTEITSNDQFYVVSKNLYSDPTVNGTSWQLVIDGAVEHPYALSYAEVMALPRKQQYESLMCISNEVGGPYMSNALWEGIPLASLLQRAGVKPGATKVVFHAADDYSDSIHLSKAIEPTTLMAVRMNGVILPQEHGFPARMLVPGIYGMKHCKWLTRIEVVNYDFLGYWQQRGWNDAAPIRMTSRIDTPLDGNAVHINRTTYIAGVAFSGNQGISEVDVSLDAGQTWRRATLKHPFSDLTWVLWEYAWQPTTSGSATVVVRAVDLQGNVQDPSEAPPLPNGSSGYHSITLNVS